MARVRYVFHPRYEMDLQGHVFPTQKYRLVRERLLAEGLARPEDFEEPEPITLDDLKLVHTPEYLDDLRHLRWTHRTMYSELPLTREIVEGFVLMAGGTWKATQLALQDGFGYHIGGGFHHAYPDHAEGFCYVNDLAYAIRRAQTEGRIERALVVDCDVHQGNGTAAIFRHDPSVFTFSIHQEELYPWPKEQSDWDIGLPLYTGDEVYLAELRAALEEIYRRFTPDLVVYQAGADPYREDQLANLRLSKEGLMERDRIVLGMAWQRRIPVVITLGGGYALRVEDTVEIHVNTARVAKELAEGQGEPS